MRREHEAELPHKEALIGFVSSPHCISKNIFRSLPKEERTETFLFLFQTLVHTEATCACMSRLPRAGANLVNIIRECPGPYQAGVDLEASYLHLCKHQYSTVNDEGANHVAGASSGG